MFSHLTQKILQEKEEHKEHDLEDEDDFYEDTSLW